MISEMPAASSVRTSFLPFALPDVDQTEIDAVVEVLRSGWLTTGARTREFEQAFARYIGCKHAVALNSCTAALHLALDAIGLTPDDEVIVPTYTFTASAEVVRYFGARPVLVDVRPDDLTIDVAAVERALTDRTRAVIGVDIAGHPCDWHHLRALAAHHGSNFVLVDDAAHALPSALFECRIGAWADLTAFSFYATKTLTTGEGGMLVTDNPVWAERARCMALHGLSHDAWDRYTTEGSWYYEVVAPGFKYNMTDIAAALGLAQLQRLDTMHRRRSAIAARYTEAFSGLPEVQVPTLRPHRTSAWHLYILRLQPGRLRCNRAEFMRLLGASNIGASVHFIPLHLHPYYRNTYGYRPGDFPCAYTEYQRAISLPIYSRMDERAVDDVISAVTRILAANRI
jgi:dTDP-4-amino-4,6-dideoxygalactose transaminase